MAQARTRRNACRVSNIASVSRLIKLTPEQFQFVRALYIAIPPISRELPPGDSAIVASAGGKAMVALVADGRTCARFLAPDFILSMLVQVGKGENGTIGNEAALAGRVASAGKGAGCASRFRQRPQPERFAARP